MYPNNLNDAGIQMYFTGVEKITLYKKMTAEVWYIIIYLPSAVFMI